jgi:sulfate transport system substrate-binding protein
MQSVAQKFASKFPTPQQLFTIDDLGGWTKVKDEFFDPDSGSITKIEQAAGVPTASS